jgi:hypothetical protein
LHAAADCKTRFDALKPLLPPNGRVFLPPGETHYGDREGDLRLGSDGAGDHRPPGFLWQTSAVAPDTAVRDLPNLKTTFRQIGNAITGRNRAPATECPPQ